MPDPLVDQLQACCLRVIGSKPGCGFFISPRFLVTCAHVVGRESAAGTTVDLERWGERGPTPFGPATLHSTFPEDDLALLELQEGPNAPRYAPLEAGASLGDELIAWGFPQRNDRQEFTTFTARYEGHTQFLDRSGRIGVEGKFKAGQVEPGFSGAPLLNLETGRIIGVVVATRDRRSDLGGWAIELSVLLGHLKAKGIELPPVTLSWTDAQAAQRELRAAKAAQLPAMDTLRQLMREAQTNALLEVEELARTLGKNQGAIRLALRSLGEHESEIADEDLAARLIESAQGFSGQLDFLTTLRPEDPQVAAQFERARQQLEREDAQGADAAYEAAMELALTRSQAAQELEAKAREVREQGQREAAQASAGRGELAMARLRYREAAGYFERAAQLLPALSEEQRVEYLWRQSDALYAQGDERGDNAALGECIGVRGRLLAAISREKAPLDWAMTQNNLGTALMRLGERESGTARLDEAVAAYRAALAERTRERVPLGWAATQANLGLALVLLGERQQSVEVITAAIEAVHAAHMAMRIAGNTQHDEYFESLLAELSSLKRQIAGGSGD